MKVFEISKCIESGSWLEGHIEDNDVRFRIRLLGFGKVDLNEIESEEECSFDLSEGVLWILFLEVVNLTKSNVSCDDIKQYLRLVDADECRYDIVEDAYICQNSEFAEKTRLKRFYYSEFKPKMKATGAVLFLVPDEETIYSIGIESGRIKEV